MKRSSPRMMVRVAVVMLIIGCTANPRPAPEISAQHTDSVAVLDQLDLREHVQGDLRNIAAIHALVMRLEEENGRLVRENQAFMEQAASLQQQVDRCYSAEPWRGQPAEPHQTVSFRPST